MSDRLNGIRTTRRHLDTVSYRIRRVMNTTAELKHLRQVERKAEAMLRYVLSQRSMLADDAKRLPTLLRQQQQYRLMLAVWAQCPHVDDIDLVRSYVSEHMLQER